MLTLLAKAPAIPIVQGSRLTCLGMQYIVTGSDYDDVVTTNSERLTCTCGNPTCAHIQAIQAQQAHNAITNARRNAYTALFDLSYAE